MNNERFLRLLNSGRGVDFQQLYRELLGYIAGRTRGLPDDTPHEILNQVIDSLQKGKGKDSWYLVREIIHDRIVDVRRIEKAKGEIIIPSHCLYEDELLPHHGYPRDRIRELPEGKERDICLLYWEKGWEQHEIATELKVSPPYVNKIIKDHKQSVDKAKRYEYRYPTTDHKLPSGMGWDTDDD